MTLTLVLVVAGGAWCAVAAAAALRVGPALAHAERRDRERRPLDLED